MARKAALVLACVCLPLAAARVSACQAHMMLNPEELGFFGRAVVRMAGLAPPEPVFKLEHPAMAKAAINAEQEITVHFSRPWFSKDVRIELGGSSNVQLPQRVIALEERKGTVHIPYRLVGSGFDSITLTVVGRHDGELVREVRRIYLRARPESPEKTRLSEREPSEGMSAKR